jgi:hypothetical protein
MQAAQQVGPRGALRPYTLSTLIGLLASTGLRAGRHRIHHGGCRADREPPVLHIRSCHKSRLVPLHASTADHLATTTPCGVTSVMTPCRRCSSSQRHGAQLCDAGSLVDHPMRAARH